jgi:centromere protein O
MNVVEFAQRILVDQVHMEADRKAMANEVNVPADLLFQSKTTYRIRDKVTCSPDH